MSLLTKIRTLRALKPLPEPELPEVARSVAIIMDGNGRWARKRRLPVAAGHRAGTKALRRTVEAAIDLGVESLTVYAFSTENWSRPADEVGALMEIFVETIERELPDLVRQGVRTRFIGRRDRAPGRAPGAHGGARGRDRATTTRCGSGSRSTTAAVPRSCRPRAGSSRRASTRRTSTRTCSRRTSTRRRCPTPTCVIRTSGELRVSNFLLWQLAYAELVFVDRLWPDFGERDLRSALAAYARRRRRFGGR